MTYPAMPSIKGSRVRDIEMAHKLGEVAITALFSFPRQVRW